MCCWRANALMTAYGIIIGGGILAAVASGCGPGFDVDEPLVRTGTVTVTGQGQVVIDSSVLLDLRAGTGEDITWRFDGTVSATSAGAAQNLAAEVDIAVDEQTSDVLLTLAAVQDGLLQGTWTITAPDSLDVRVVGRGPGQQITGFEGNVSVEAAVAVSVLQSEGNVTVRSGGDVFVDTLLGPGRTVDVNTSGSIQLALPLTVSARIEVQVGDNGAISIQHPQLPSTFTGQKIYVANVGGSLGLAVLVSSGGSVFISPAL